MGYRFLNKKATAIKISVGWFIVCYLLILLVGCTVPTPEERAKKIDEVFVESYLLDSIPVTGERRSLLLVGQLIEPNQDTLFFYQDTIRQSLIKIMLKKYNPDYEKNQDSDYLVYYFLNENLNKVMDVSIVDYGRVAGINEYYFNKRICFYDSGPQNRLKNHEWLLERSDEYLDRFKHKNYQKL